MKRLIILSAILTSTTVASADFRALGAANVSECEASFGIVDVRVIAEAQAKEAADKNCDGRKAIKTGIQILSKYRGSCWAGTHSGIALELTYTCN